MKIFAFLFALSVGLAQEKEILFEAWVDGKKVLIPLSEILANPELRGPVGPQGPKGDTGEPGKDHTGEKDADETPVNPPWPTVELIPGSKGGAYARTRSAALLDNGDISGLPYKNEFAPYVYADGRETTFLDRGLRGEHGGGWIDAIDHSNGNTYHLPAYARSIAVTNRKSGSLSFVGKLNYSPQIRSGGELGNGWLAMMDFVSNPRIWIYDPANDELLNIPFENKENPGERMTFGAAKDAFGNVVFPPLRGKSITRITSSLTVEQSSKPITGNIVQGYKYSGGCYNPKFKTSYFFPRAARAVLIYSGEKGIDDFEEVKFPPELTEELGKKNAAFDCFIAPDGWIYSVPFATTIMIRINPETQAIQWKDFPEFKMNHHGQGYFSRGVPRSGGICLMPLGFPQAAQLNFSK